MGVRPTEFSLATVRSAKGHSTGREAAEAIGIPSSTMARMEQGNDESLSARQKVAKHYGMTLERLHVHIDNSREERRKREIEKAHA